MSEWPAALLSASRLLEAINAAAFGLYRAGLRRSRRAGATVISVGNLALGGAGKTPLVAALAGELLRLGMRPAILTRGYGRRAQETVFTQGGAPSWEEVGDEPALLARLLPDVPLAVGADRWRGSELMLAQRSVTHFILDDGFQHWRLERELDIVVLDGADPFSRRRPRREGPGALRRAHAAVISNLPAPRIPVIVAEIRTRFPHLQV
ncbi:MAG: tetraacyldisaccharide 4'-kinase, partial [Acidobacteriota bacterium]